MSEQAKISLTIHGNTFEIAGPESFVSAQAEAFRDAIIDAMSKASQETPDSPREQADEPPAAPHIDPSVGPQKAAYPRVVDISDEKVSILKSVPGTTLSKKAVGTALVYLWAKRTQGKDSVPFADIREVCKSHGCLDATNFSSHMKSAREWIIVDGTKGSSAQTCRLTIPGVEKAEETLKQLNAE